MKEKLTAQEYEEISRLVEYALNAPSKKEAQKYIDKIQSYGYGLSGRVSYIFTELVCYVKDASGRVGDKARREYSANSKLYELGCYGVEE